MMKRKAFTLIELMVTMVLGLLVLNYIFKFELNFFKRD
jgi:prepilin-type N-terminal cleavage/methylation domain-containing protein